MTVTGESVTQFSSLSVNVADHHQGECMVAGGGRGGESDDTLIFSDEKKEPSHLEQVGLISCQEILCLIYEKVTEQFLF